MVHNFVSEASRLLPMQVLQHGMMEYMRTQSMLQKKQQHPNGQWIDKVLRILPALFMAGMIPAGWYAYKQYNNHCEETGMALQQVHKKQDATQKHVETYQVTATTILYF